MIILSSLQSEFAFCVSVSDALLTRYLLSNTASAIVTLPSMFTSPYNVAFASYSGFAVDGVVVVVVATVVFAVVVVAAVVVTEPLGFLSV